MKFTLLQTIVCTLFISVKAGTFHSDLALSENLWSGTLQEREAALNSTLINGMLSAKLNPNSFGAYMNQHTVFIYNTKRIIGLALQRARNGTVKELLQNMFKSYKEKSDIILKEYSIKYPSGILLGRACSKYFSHLYDMATNYDAVYFITAMLPRDKLWPWLGKKLSSKQNDFGVYTEWVKTNLDPSYTGYTELETVINEAEEHNSINRMMALFAFKQSMESERDFFSSVP